MTWSLNTKYLIELWTCIQPSCLLQTSVVSFLKKKKDTSHRAFVSDMAQLSCFSKTKVKKKKKCNYATKNEVHSAKPQMLKGGNNR